MRSVKTFDFATEVEAVEVQSGERFVEEPVHALLRVLLQVRDDHHHHGAEPLPQSLHFLAALLHQLQELSRRQLEEGARPVELGRLLLLRLRVITISVAALEDEALADSAEVKSNLKHILHGPAQGSALDVEHAQLGHPLQEFRVDLHESVHVDQRRVHGVLLVLRQLRLQL